MRLARLHLVRMVTVPGGKLLGETQFGDACESTFSAADGWELHETSTQGVFSIRAPHMLQAMVVGGYGYTYMIASPEHAPVDATKGKRR